MTAEQLTRPRLVGVGVGPGDPELLTLKAARLLQQANVVFAPVRRDGERSMALQIAGTHVDPTRQEIVTLPFPDRGRGEAWDAAADTIIATLGADRLGVFLTEGDPLLFGTFGYVLTALRTRAPHLTVETVPGITSVTAAAAAAGRPLAEGAERLAVLPATGRRRLVEQALLDYECVVLLKVGPVLGTILELLADLDLLDHGVYVRRCGQPEQQIVTDLRALQADPPADYFALLIVHRPLGARTAGRRS